MQGSCLHLRHCCAGLTWLRLMGPFKGLQGGLHPLVCYLACTGPHCLRSRSRQIGEVSLKTFLCLFSNLWWQNCFATGFASHAVVLAPHRTGKRPAHKSAQLESDDLLNYKCLPRLCSCSSLRMGCCTGEQPTTCWLSRQNSHPAYVLRSVGFVKLEGCAAISGPQNKLIGGRHRPLA